MKICKILMLLLCLCVLFQCIPAANAAGVIEDKNVSLTLSYKDGEIPLAGATFKIYHIAAVDTHGELTATLPFQSFDVEIRGKNDQAWLALIEKLEKVIPEQEILPAAEGKTDADGLLTFPGNTEKLKQGLYLVMGEQHLQNGRVYETTPFLVMLPSLDPAEDAWIYDVAVNSKHHSVPAGELVEYQVQKVWDDAGYESSRPKEIKVDLFRNGEAWETVILSKENNWSYGWEELDPEAAWTVKEHKTNGYLQGIRRDGNVFYVINIYTPKLPQTGQLNWPIPLMAVGGLCLLVLGLGMCCSGIRKRR